MEDKHKKVHNLDKWNELENMSLRFIFEVEGR